MRIIHTCIALLALARVSSAAVLYDGSLGTAPEAQPWLTYFSDSASAVKTTNASSTTLNTTAAQSISAGFSNYNIATFAQKNAAFPVLNRTTGYSIRLDATLLSDAITNPNRAALSIIALSSDQQGIEIAIQSGKIFSQNSDFTQGEVTTAVNTALQHSYTLNVQGSSYALLVDGSEVLSGALRSYTTPAIPYALLPNYLFVGDDTSSAGGSFSFSYLNVTVPEPGTAMAGIAVVLASTFASRRRA